MHRRLSVGSARLTAQAFPPAGGPRGTYTLPPYYETRAKEYCGQEAEDDPENANAESAEAAEMPVDEKQENPFAGPLKICWIVVGSTGRGERNAAKFCVSYDPPGKEETPMNERRAIQCSC